jgi:hypothetical protein
MKRFLICLVVVIAVAALVAPAYAVESKFGGLWRVRAFSQDNVTNGDDNNDDNIVRVDQRLRLYYFGVASENFRVVARLETDANWGDPNTGGQRGADKITIELKNSYIDFNVPGAPIRAQIGIQGIAFHRGWFVADDFAAARFDFNFDPASLMFYFAMTAKDGVGAGAADYTDTSDTEFQAVLSGAYKQEMWSGRLSLAYERGQNNGPNSSAAALNIKADDLYVLMFDVDAGMDMWSAFLTAGFNFGSVDKIVPTATDANQDYKGMMVDLGGKYAFDPVAVNASFFYVSGQELNTATGAVKKPGDIEVFTYLNGKSHYWAEILGFGVFDVNGIGDDPTNTMAFNLGVSGKASDTTDVSFQYWYVTAVEDVLSSGTVAAGNAKFETDVGSEVDLIITQTIYEGFKATLVGAYLFAGDGYAGWLGTPVAAGQTADDAFETGIQLQYTW